MIEITFLRMASDSPTGLSYANKKRVMLGEPLFNMIIHAPLPPAKKTALAVAGMPENYRTIEIQELSGAKNEENQRALDQLFAEVGHMPLSVYDKYDSQHQLLFHATLLAWVKTQKEIGSIMRSVHYNGEVLVVGQGILISSMVREILLLHNQDGAAESLTNAPPLEECQGYVLGVKVGQEGVSADQVSLLKEIRD